MKLAPLFFFLCSISIGFAQNRARNYRIHVGNKSIVLQDELRSEYLSLMTDVSIVFEDGAFLFIQFNDVPTDQNKIDLLANGVELFSYIPNYCWVAKVNTDVSLSTLEAFGVRHLGRLENTWKMSDDMRLGIVPEYAGSEQDAQVNVLFWSQSESMDYTSILSEFDLTVESVDIEHNSARVLAATSILIELSKHPLVQYIEFVEPPFEDEGIKDESEQIVSTYISHNNGKGYYFNGAGVNIGVDEGGILDTLENPNYRSRIVRTYESGTTVGGHKTGVGARMAKAGNIDPQKQGTAFGADLYSGGLGMAEVIASDIVITNRSYGWGCPGSSETYNSASANYDSDIRNNPEWIITHSAGNSGSSNCYVGTAGWGNITGMAKMAKNIFAVGSSNSDGDLTGFSSRGPAKDGRILPHIVSPGPGGTSHASPNLAGVFGQLNHAFRYHYSIPPLAGVLKAIIMNTADDMENPGPDFRTGFGHVNARRAYEVISAGQFTENNISHGGTIQHAITVPVNTKKLKVMVYWVDWEATAGISSRSLVNDIDIELEDPTGTIYQPWVLNPTFDPILLDMPAVRATDTLNNHEQVTIDNPIAGTYQLRVDGTLIPQGPQQYFMTYEFVTDEIVVTHPHGDERFVSGETERLRWDACDSNLMFNISFSNDDGVSWSSIVTGLNPDSRFYDWTVPQDVTNQAKIRVERSTTSGISDTCFNISGLPENLQLVWSCADSSLFIWDEFQNADGYVIYRIIGDYMDSVAYTTDNSIVLHGLSLVESEYISIALIQNGVEGRRVIAIEREPVNLNCNMDDLGALEVISPGANHIPSCMAFDVDVVIKVRNWGVNAVNVVPIAYRLNNGGINLDTVFATIPSGGEYDFTFLVTSNLSLGANVIEAWTQFAGDGVSLNDTIVDTITVYLSASVGPNITEDFDSFTNCSTAWDCELVSCSLQNGWYNIPNGFGDDIDWRTHNGATGSGNTGPSFDHTSGSGKYIYIEGSGPCNNSMASLYSPCIDLTNINTATLSFWYHAWGSSIGELHVDALADGEYFEDIMTPIIGEQGNQWYQKVVDLSQFADRQLIVIIRGSNGGNGWLSDLALDDINISTGPIADYIANQTQLCNNDIVTLSNYSLYGDSYHWSFQPNTVTYEGGTSASSIDPQISFSNPGYYTVQLVASNTVGEDTLTMVDHIYVWEDQPSLMPISICKDDSVIVEVNNNGLSVAYYINGTVDYMGNNGMHYFANAQDGDSIFVAFTVTNSCTLYSDTVEVDIIDVDSGISQSGLQIMASAVGAQYQWLDCLNDNVQIIGETEQIYLPLINGEYAVQVTENGCVDTSDCMLFTTASIPQGNLEKISCYPNPTLNDVTIQFGSIQGFVFVELYSVQGKILKEINFKGVDSMKIDLPNEAGVYLLHVLTENGWGAVRVLKE